MNFPPFVLIANSNNLTAQFSPFLNCKCKMLLALEKSLRLQIIHL